MRRASPSDGLLVELFWTIVVYAFIFGMGALGGFIFFYWFMVVPDRVDGMRH